MNEELQVIDEIITRRVNESGLVEGLIPRRKKDPVKQALLQKRDATGNRAVRKARISAKQDIKFVALGTGAVGAGVVATKPYSKGMLTGRETLFHGTRKVNVASIRRRGLRASQAARKGSLTQNVMSHSANNKHFKGLTYADKFRSGAQDVNRSRAFQYQRLGGIGSLQQKILKLRIPSDKINRVPNPEIKYGNWENMTPKELKQMASQFGEKQVVTMKGSVSPRYIVGSKYYQRVTPREILKYARKRPGKFASGVALTAGGAAGALALGRATWRQHRKVKIARNEFKVAQKGARQASAAYRKRYTVLGRKRKPVLSEVVDSFYGPSALHVGKGSVTPKTLARNAKAQGIRQWRKEVKKPFKGVKVALRHRKRSTALFKQGRLGRAIRARSRANAVLKNRLAPMLTGSAVWTGMAMLPGQTTAAVASTKAARKLTKVLRSKAVRRLGSL